MSTNGRTDGMHPVHDLGEVIELFKSGEINEGYVFVHRDRATQEAVIDDSPTEESHLMVTAYQDKMDGRPHNTISERVYGFTNEGHAYSSLVASTSGTARFNLLKTVLQEADAWEDVA